MENVIDVQSQTDERNVTIDKVGVKNIRYPIVVEDRTNKIQSTVAELDMFVELPHHHRGTHMSRFLEVLNKFHRENLIENLEALLLQVKTAMKADAAYVNIRFPYFMKKTAPVSRTKSLLSYDCSFQASLKKEFHLLIGVRVPITTLCPCSREISDFGAHNQRSLVKLEVSFSQFVWLEELIETAEAAASCEIYPLLKRVDEKHVTEKAFRNPAFVEDIVRNITLELQRDERIDFFKVEAENFESIHDHNAYASVSRTKGEQG